MAGIGERMPVAAMPQIAGLVLCSWFSASRNKAQFWSVPIPRIWELQYTHCMLHWVAHYIPEIWSIGSNWHHFNNNLLWMRPFLAQISDWDIILQRPLPWSPAGAGHQGGDHPRRGHPLPHRPPVHLVREDHISIHCSLPKQHLDIPRTLFSIHQNWNICNWCFSRNESDKLFLKHSLLLMMKANNKSYVNGMKPLALSVSIFIVPKYLEERLFKT